MTWDLRARIRRMGRGRGLKFTTGIAGVLGIILPGEVYRQDNKISQKQGFPESYQILDLIKLEFTFWKQNGIARMPTPIMELANVTTFVESGPMVVGIWTLKPKKCENNL